MFAVILIFFMIFLGPFIIHFQDIGVKLHFSTQDLFIHFFYAIMTCAVFIWYSRHMTKKRRSAEDDLQTLLNTLECGVVKIIFDGELKRKALWANEGFYKLTGSTREEYAKEESSGNPSNVLHPDDIKPVFDAFHQHVLHRTNFYLEYRVLHKKGHIVWLGVQAVYVGEERGFPVFLCVMIDITERKNMEERAEWELKRNQAINAVSGELLFEYDGGRDELRFFGGYEAILGQNFAQVPNFIGKLKEQELVHSDDIDVVRQLFLDMADGPVQAHAVKKKFRLRCRAGDYCWFLPYLTAIADKKNETVSIGKLMDFHDITLRMDSLGKKAESDSMTGLLNKAATRKYIEHRLRTAPDGSYAFVLLDIDHFKAFNDNEGHMFGDKVIITVSSLLKKTFRATDIIGRFGGDEFLVLLCDVTPEAALFLMDRYVEALRATGIHTSGRRLSNSIGISFAPRDGRDFESLFSAADKAVYKAKSLGRDCIVTTEPRPEKTFLHP